MPKRRNPPKSKASAPPIPSVGLTPKQAAAQGNGGAREGAGRKTSEITRIKRELGAAYGPECFGNLMKIVRNPKVSVGLRAKLNLEVVRYWLGKPTQRFELGGDGSFILDMISTARANDVAQIAAAAKRRSDE